MYEATLSGKIHTASALGLLMKLAPETTQRLLWVGLVLGAIGLLINGIDWWQGTLNFALPKLMDQVGMLLLVGSLLTTRLSTNARTTVAIFALLLIVPSTALILFHSI
jgi:hypothetical protein